MSAAVFEEIMAIQKETNRTLDHVTKRLGIVSENMDRLEKNVDRLEKNVDRVTGNVGDLEKTVDRVTRNMGGLNNSIGEIVEMIVIPGLKGKMNAHNHNFTMASPRKEYSDVDGSTLMEVDLLLENCDEVMVVEVKTQVSLKWVNRHLKRLELLRKKENITGMTGKTIYAAVAGIGFDEEARALAVDSGMYLIEIEEEQEKVKIIPPGKVRQW